MTSFTNEEISRIWLSYADMTPAKKTAIISTYGSAYGFARSFKSGMREVLPEGAFAELDRMRDKTVLANALNEINRLGIRVLTPESKHMPETLMNLADAPLLLYFLGDESLLSSPRSIAIIGTRSPSAYGSMMASAIAASLAKYGATVVSGLARGIDMTAQEAVVNAGGKTIAVLGNGIDSIYPPENEPLKRRILESGGLILSEYPPGTPPKKHHFPQRNRIISVLSQGVLLIEGKINGGGIITVGHALEQGKDVFVLPGRAHHELYEAPHKLIRDGARLVTGGEDIAEDMGWEPPEADLTVREQMTPEQEIIVGLLTNDELSFDELADKTGLPAAGLSSVLTILELMGIIRQSAGRMYMKVKKHPPQHQ
ncbi:MAG: DNA-processing protein DprA [Clostridia bacterium]|nr:DNA-processing protein DprA [Clostridia bacterium]